MRTTKQANENNTVTYKGNPEKFPTNVKGLKPWMIKVLLYRIIAREVIFVEYIENTQYRIRHEEIDEGTHAIENFLRKDQKIPLSMLEKIVWNLRKEGFDITNEFPYMTQDDAKRITQEDIDLAFKKAKDYAEEDANAERLEREIKNNVYEDLSDEAIEYMEEHPELKEYAEKE